MFENQYSAVGKDGLAVARQGAHGVQSVAAGDQRHLRLGAESGERGITGRNVGRIRKYDLEAAIGDRRGPVAKHAAHVCEIECAHIQRCYRERVRAGIDGSDLAAGSFTSDRDGNRSLCDRRLHPSRAGGGRVGPVAAKPLGLFRSRPAVPLRSASGETLARPRRPARSGRAGPASSHGVQLQDHDAGSCWSTMSFTNATR